MSVRFLVAALMLVLASPLSASDTVKVTHLYSFRVSLDEQGRITRAEPLDEIPAPVSALVAGLVQDADFEPARVADRPVPSRTTLIVRVDFEGNQQHLRVASTKLTSGGGLDPTPPRYPPRAMASQIGALVSTHVVYRVDGSLDREASRIENLEVFGGKRSMKHDPIRKSFEDAVWTTLAGWTMRPDEVDGQPIAMSTRVPMSFCPLVGRNGECKIPRIQEAQRPRDPHEPRDKLAGWLPVDAGIQLARLKSTVPGTQVAEQP